MPRCFCGRLYTVLLHRRQYIVALYEVIDKGTGVPILQLQLGNTCLEEELIENLIVFVARQIEALVRVPTDVADMFKVRRLTDVCFGHFALLVLGMAAESKAARQEAVFRRRRRQRYRVDHVVAQLNWTTVSG